MNTSALPIYPKRPNQLPEARYLLGQYKHIEPATTPTSFQCPFRSHADGDPNPMYENHKNLARDQNYLSKLGNTFAKRPFRA
jgi:hypothetical protein